jgi:predicted Co/Zn/Cd cation transporter (cation efflux family)
MEKFKQEEEERQRLENAMRERIEKRKKELAAKRVYFLEIFNNQFIDILVIIISIRNKKNVNKWNSSNKKKKRDNDLKMQ